MSFLAIVQLLLLHLLPKRVLLSWLSKRLERGPYVFSPQFSGRVAIYVIAKMLRRQTDRSVALVPDYVCNVVPKALRTAGWEVEEYSTNDLMEADWECVERRLRVGDVGLLVGASVFGSSALLERLHDSDTAALLRGHGVHVLVDLAQDIRLTRYLPAAAHDIVWAILSFNNKSFPGVMGGGILGRAPVGVVRKELAPGQRRFLYHVLSMTILLRLVRYKKPTLGTGYDFSHCTDFPYQIEGHVYEPIKLQYAMALIGMRSLRRFDKLKARVLRLDAHLPTRFASTAAYLVLKEPREELRDQEIKAPYALDAEPRRSLRPDQLVIHNKGFADRVR